MAIINDGNIQSGVRYFNTVSLSSGTSINEFSIDGTMAGNSDDAVPTEKALVAYTGANFLKLDNTTPFIPDADYEPATKKYVDDTVGGSVPYNYINNFSIFGSTDHLGFEEANAVYSQDYSLGQGITEITDYSIYNVVIIPIPCTDMMIDYSGGAFTVDGGGYVRTGSNTDWTIGTNAYGNGWQVKPNSTAQGATMGMEFFGNSIGVYYSTAGTSTATQAPFKVYLYDATDTVNPLRTKTVVISSLEENAEIILFNDLELNDYYIKLEFLGNTNITTLEILGFMYRTHVIQRPATEYFFGTLSGITKAEQETNMPSSMFYLDAKTDARNSAYTTGAVWTFRGSNDIYSMNNQSLVTTHVDDTITFNFYGNKLWLCFSALGDTDAVVQLSIDDTGNTVDSRYLNLIDGTTANYINTDNRINSEQVRIFRIDDGDLTDGWHKVSIRLHKLNSGYMRFCGAYYYTEDTSYSQSYPIILGNNTQVLGVNAISGAGHTITYGGTWTMNNNFDKSYTKSRNYTNDASGYLEYSNYGTPKALYCMVGTNTDRGVIKITLTRSDTGSIVYFLDLDRYSVGTEYAQVEIMLYDINELRNSTGVSNLEITAVRIDKIDATYFIFEGFILEDFSGTEKSYGNKIVCTPKFSSSQDTSYYPSATMSNALRINAAVTGSLFNKTQPFVHSIYTNDAATHLPRFQMGAFLEDASIWTAVGGSHYSLVHKNAVFSINHYYLRLGYFGASAGSGTFVGYMAVQLNKVI